MSAEEQTGQQNKPFQNMQAQAAPQAEEQLEKKPADDKSISYRYCKYCERPLASNEVFCMRCGEKYGGEENICSCGTATTKKICPNCQKVLVPHTCPKCSAKTFNAICACGAILDKNVQALQAAQIQADAAPAPAIRQLSAEEVKKIEELFRIEEENPDYKKLQKRLIDRERLLMERDYYNKMQKEIIEVFGERPLKIELPDPEEQAARMRIYASLERSIIQKQRRATQEELEALYPELQYIHEAENKASEEKAAAEEENQKRRLEQAKRQKEMEEKYREILEGIEKDIQEARDGARQADEAKKAEDKKRLLAQKTEEEAMLRREREEAEKRAREEAARRERIAAMERAAAEAKAKAEAERRAREEAKITAQREKERREAQEHAERQAYLNRMLGTYVHNKDGNVLTLVITYPTHAYHNSKYANRSAAVYSELKVLINGSKVKMERTANPENFNFADIFNGEINSRGTIISGNYIQQSGEYNDPVTYYKVK